MRHKLAILKNNHNSLSSSRKCWSFHKSRFSPHMVGCPPGRMNGEKNHFSRPNYYQFNIRYLLDDMMSNDHDIIEFLMFFSLFINAT